MDYEDTETLSGGQRGIEDSKFSRTRINWVKEEKPEDQAKRRKKREVKEGSK